MKRTSILIVFLGVILSGSLLWAESQARIVRLSLVDGSVELDRAAGQGFERAILNMPITQGMRLRAGSGSNAEVEFESGSTLRLIGNTSVSFGRLSLDSDGNKVTAVNVEEGTAYFNVKKKGHDEFAISFAGREIRVTESSHLRVDVSDSRAEVAMFKGEAELAQDRSVHIKKDQTIAFDRQAGSDDIAEGSAYDVAQGVTDEPSDTWDKQRQETLTSQQNLNQPINSPYAYGMSDLGMYGSYYVDPVYGYVWRPYDAAYNWDPYSDGAWMWYPGYGYTWVSSYPWGWMPYRHGRWVFLPAYGWVWQPGYWNTWWRGPVCVNAPHYYNPPRPPRHHDHHVVFVGNPQPNWPRRPNDPDHDRGRIHTRTHDNDDSGGRKTVTMSAPGPATTTTKAGVSASGFTGGNANDNVTVTTPGDRDIVRGNHDPDRGKIRLIDRGKDRDDDTPRAATGRPVVAPQNTPPQNAGPQNTQPGTAHVDHRQPAQPSVQPRSETRPAPRPSTPAPSRVEPSRSAPTPHVDAPHSSGAAHSGGGSRESGSGKSPK
jgi:uncharacterized protein DUF6600/FecR-like protein